MSKPAIRLESAGKMYKVFPSRGDTFVHALGLSKVMPWRKSRFREFWALRDVTFELAAGQRLGIIGRNGAGKSTMLKMITGAIAQTEGDVEVTGQVQALLDAGAGLHPEFTGKENIFAALTYQGLNRAEIAAAELEIADFTELGAFLDQPFRTYSLGMQARLGFAISTVVRPEILIVDEILGAGDAYFFTKSTGRMLELVESGCTVLIVSHSLEHVVRFCDQTLWLDRGKVVMQGPTLDVVKAYEKYIRVLENKRLRAQNAKRQALPADGFEREGLSEQVLVRVAPGAATGSRCDVAGLSLYKDGVLEETLDVGGVQDADEFSSSRVLLREGSWSSPRADGETSYRSVVAEGDMTYGAFGHAIFGLWFFYPDSDYVVEIRYRSSGAAPMVGVGRGSHVDAFDQLPPSDDWRVARVALAAVEDVAPEKERETEVDETARSRWPGRQGLLIDRVELLDQDDQEQAIFVTGSAVTIRLGLRAETAGDFPLTLAALVFRADGIVAMRHVSEPMILTLAARDTFDVRLVVDDLLLGNGDYLLSVGLYAKLDINDIEPSEIYDYFDRSFAFRVVGNPRVHNELYRQPGQWEVDPPRPSARQVPSTDRSGEQAVHRAGTR